MTIAMPPVQFADLGAIHMAYYEAGCRSSERPSLILCHGFPETGYSWRHQIRAFSENGWHVIAIDQRGYGQTSAPEDVSGYDAETICNEYEVFLDHLQLDEAVFIGHDWGGAMVWQMAMRRPKRVMGAVSLNTPFRKRPQADPIQLLRERMGPEMYMVHFQMPDEPDAILADARRTLNYFYKLPAEEGVQPGGSSNLALVREIAEYDAERDTRRRFLSDEEFDFYVSEFERTGFTGGINWYRNMTRNWETAAAYDHVITQPSLMVMAELDPFLPPALASEMDDVIPDLEKALIKGCGHWSQQEQPDEVNRIVLDWLNRRFAQVGAAR